jgi:hypothetical protein
MIDALDDIRVRDARYGGVVRPTSGFGDGLLLVNFLQAPDADRIAAPIHCQIRMAPSSVPGTVSRIGVDPDVIDAIDEIRIRDARYVVPQAPGLGVTVGLP